MALDGPILASKKHCLWAWTGPLQVLRKAAYGLGWGPFELVIHCLKAWMGPLQLLRKVANGLGWAHARCWETLPISSIGPTATTVKSCQWPWMGPVKLLENTAHTLEWANCWPEKLLMALNGASLVGTEIYHGNCLLAWMGPLQVLRKLSMDLNGLTLGTKTSCLSQIQMLWNHSTETLSNAECHSDLTMHCLEVAGPPNHLIHQYPINKVCELDRLCLRCASISDHLVPSISDVKTNNANYVSAQSQAPYAHGLAKKTWRGCLHFLHGC